MENDKKRDVREDNRDGRNQDPQTGAAKAAQIDAVIGSATDAARAHRHTDTWSNQGTNTSYEGATAPGGGGSVGTGQTSGQDATGARISSDDEQDHANAGSNKDEREGSVKQEEQDDTQDADTIGIP